MLPTLLQRGQVDARLIQRIARRVARFHAEAPTGPGVDEFGSLAAVQANWDENFSQTASFSATMLVAGRTHQLQAYVGRFLSEHAALFERRLASGRIRDGHGDLHLDSICVDGRRVLAAL